jgi:hypothetical protein
MSLINGISALGAGLNAFAGNAAADMAAPPRTPLMATPAPEATLAAPATLPSDTPVASQASDSAGHKSGETLILAGKFRNRRTTRRDRRRQRTVHRPFPDDGEANERGQDTGNGQPAQKAGLSSLL